MKKLFDIKVSLFSDFLEYNFCLKNKFSTTSGIKKKIEVAIFNLGSKREKEINTYDELTIIS